MATEQQDDGYIEIGGWLKDQDDPFKQAWDGAAGPKLPPGEYLVDVTEAKKSMSNAKNPQVEVQYTVVEGEHEGATIRAWYAMTEKAIGRLLNVLQACGLALDARGGFSITALVGQRLHIGVMDNTYEKGRNPVTDEPIMVTNSKVFGEKAYVPPRPQGKSAAAGKAK